LTDNFLGLHCSSTSSSLVSVPFLSQPHQVLQETPAYDRDPTQTGPPYVQPLSIGGKHFLPFFWSKPNDAQVQNKPKI
jgi:hypothetical protein